MGNRGTECGEWWERGESEWEWGEYKWNRKNKMKVYKTQFCFFAEIKKKKINKIVGKC